MSMVATDIKDLFKISIKARHDTYTDQYNRIFMVKILLACTIVMGLCWYTDKFNCMVPEMQGTYEDFPDFVGTTCWIQGMYVYKELRNHTDNLAYYGIPVDSDFDGMMDGKSPCQVGGDFARRHNKKCVPMTKTFYTQYQYMPFYIATLALLYFLPYMIHKTINHDLINLREQIKKEKPDIEDIVKHYFKERKSKRSRPYFLTIRQIMNVFVKLAYIIVNLVALFGTDSLLEGEFYDYGRKWVSWSKHNNTIAYDYMGARDFPKPGNEMLPPFGYCELYSSAKDVLNTYNNKHKVICEISQHILYQYVFILIWFAIIIGIVVSIIGFILLIINYLTGIVGICKLGNGNTSSQRIFDSLTYREIEYLEFMRKKNIPVYGEVLDRLREKHLSGSPAESVSSSSYNHQHKSDFPMVPLKQSQAPYAL